VAAGLEIAIPAILSGISAAGAANATVGSVLFAVGVGAAIGAMGLLLSNKKPGSRRTNSDLDITTSIRNVPVPVLYGRARLSGNYIAMGGFGGVKDRIQNTEGRRLRIAHAVLSACEGPIQAAGNYHLDGKSLIQTRKAEDFARHAPGWRINYLPGTADEDVHPFVSDEDSRFPGETKIPWRNTAKILLHSVVGDQPRLPDVNADVFGPDLSVEFGGGPGSEEIEVDPGLVVSFGYDAYSERFWVCTTARMHLLSRRGEATVLVEPPDNMDGDVAKGWYLGRHDIICFQDPSDSGLFHLGYSGISRNPQQWERVRPDPSIYTAAMSAAYLDELNGILHSLHSVGGEIIIARWWLLTGRVDRIVAKDSIGGSFIYSPDFDAYVSGGSLYNPADGALIIGGGVGGNLVSGTRVGTLSAGGLIWWAPFEKDGEIKSGMNVAPEAGGIEEEGKVGSALAFAYNSWTNHVTMLHPDGLVNMFVSVIEGQEDISALGTTGECEFQVYDDPDGPFFIKNKPEVDPPKMLKWWRDWSPRSFSGSISRIRNFEGHSSLAGAIWSTIVEETAGGATDNPYNFERWGAGIPEKYVSRSSVEALHGWAVGCYKFRYPKRTVYNEELDKNCEIKAYKKWGERAKFDYLLDAETTLSDLLSSEMLASVNGYRTIHGGKMHIVANRPGLFGHWHFTEGQVKDGEIDVTFLGRGANPNRVRVQFTHVRDEYRKDFAEANDEWDQDIRGRVQSETLGLNGIARFGHADWLANHVLDSGASARRQVSFSTHYLWMLITPGDGIDVSHRGAGLRKVTFRVMNVEENEEGVGKIVALEHKKTAPGAPVPSNASVGVGEGSGDTGERCPSVRARLDDGIAWFFNGAAVPAVSFTIGYLANAYQRFGDPEHYFVEGFDVVTLDPDNNVEVILGSAPGEGEFDTVDDAEEGNAGLKEAFSLSSPGPVGILLRQSYRPYGSLSMNAPSFELCFAGGSGSGGGGEADICCPDNHDLDTAERLKITFASITIRDCVTSLPFDTTYAGTVTGEYILHRTISSCHWTFGAYPPTCPLLVSNRTLGPGCGAAPEFLQQTVFIIDVTIVDGQIRIIAYDAGFGVRGGAVFDALVPCGTALPATIPNAIVEADSSVGWGGTVKLEIAP
jgi:hypothetical protein